MADLLLNYWWAVALCAAGGSFVLLQLLGRRFRDSMVDGILAEAQAGFSAGNVEVHSVRPVRTLDVQGEQAVLYQIDATVSPSDEQVEWCGGDLFLRGVSGDPNQVGDVLTLQRWNGATHEPAKNRAQLVGTQRLLLSVRYGGTPGGVCFTHNFGRFGPAFQLPQLQAGV